MDSARFLVKKGFTLIELLIVIAVLGVLAVVILIAINPVQQLARTRDAGRTNGVQQLGHALEAYTTFHNGAFVYESGVREDGSTPCTVTNWIGCLVDAGEITSVPAGVSYRAGFTGCVDPTVVNATWCYDTAAENNAGPIVVYARLEADASVNRCNVGAGQAAYAVYSSADGRGGLVCSATEPVSGNQVFLP